MSGRLVLVTGATGGLGGALVREALARGHSVRAVGRSRERGRALADQGADFVQMDLAAPGADLSGLLDGCESVIHAAALSAGWGRRADFHAANVQVTGNLLAGAGQSWVRRFVFVSSPSIYASFRDRCEIGPDDLPASTPLNAYVETKLLAERAVLAQRGRRMARCAIRPRALVGEGDRVILPRLAELARRRRMPLPRGGRALVELTDLRDAARAICEAEERVPALDGAAINISGGQPVAVRALAARLAEALGESPEPLDVPLPLARLLAGGLETLGRLRRTEREPSLTRYALATLAYSQTFDLAPARRLLGYEPRYDAVETLLAEARKLARGEGAA